MKRNFLPLAMAMALLAENARAEDAASSAIGAQIVARTTAQIGAPMAGQLVEFPLSDGEVFQEGQLLARFKCDQSEAMTARARAEMEKRRSILATQQSLKALNAYSKADFTTAQNDVLVAQAELAVAQTTVANCVVKAPFAGRIANIAVHNFQFVQMGAPLMDILDDHDLEVELVVPSRWLVWLTTGKPLRITISETQATYDAHITRLSGRVEPASQTIKVYARIDGPAPALLPGMSGKAVFPDEPK
jgi:membrane fusion protein, multidrug efflux system